MTSAEMPADVTLTEGLPDDVEQVTFTVDLMPDGAIRPVRMDVKARAGVGISGTTLREIQVSRLAARAVAQVVPDVAYSEEERAAIRANGPTPESLRAVARIYESARIVGKPPAREIEIQLGLPRTTASKWIRRAREVGLGQLVNVISPPERNHQ